MGSGSKPNIPSPTRVWHMYFHLKPYFCYFLSSFDYLVFYIWFPTWVGHVICPNLRPARSAVPNLRPRSSDLAWAPVIINNEDQVSQELNPKKKIANEICWFSDGETRFFGGKTRYSASTCTLQARHMTLHTSPVISCISVVKIKWWSNISLKVPEIWRKYAIMQKNWRYLTLFLKLLKIL